MPLSDTPCLETVYERDIEFLLLEEFHSETEFVRWFVESVSGRQHEKIEFVGAWHSICDPKEGESDIVLLVDIGTKYALLLENKIDAAAQPEQVSRYFKRGEQGKAGGEWESFCACIVAPSKYLASDPEASIYDARIAYEDIREWMQQHLPHNKRTEWKVKLLTEAIDPDFRSRDKIFDERVTAFFHDYARFADNEFPDLGIKKMKRPSANAPWQEFCPRGLTGKYSNTKTYHFFYPGPRKHYVCVEFTGLGAQMAKIVDVNRELVPDGVQWELRQKKNVWLKTFVPSISTTDAFNGQINEVRVILTAASKLSTLASTIKLD
jgi:hypothetical protein